MVSYPKTSTAGQRSLELVESGGQWGVGWVGVGGGVGGQDTQLWGKGWLYLMLHCHHQNDCIKNKTFNGVSYAKMFHLIKRDSHLSGVCGGGGGGGIYIPNTAMSSLEWWY